jgi:uncharacterized membrane protein
MSETPIEGGAPSKVGMWERIKAQMVWNVVVIVGGTLINLRWGLPALITYVALCMGVTFLIVGFFQPQLEHMLPQMDWRRFKESRHYRLFYVIGGAIALVAGLVGLMTLLQPR